MSLARDADLLIAECSVANGHRVPGHLTPRAVGQVAALRWGRRARSLRFDVVTVVRTRGAPQIEHLEGAFRLGE